MALKGISGDGELGRGRCGGGNQRADLNVVAADLLNDVGVHVGRGEHLNLAVRVSGGARTGGAVLGGAAGQKEGGRREGSQRGEEVLAGDGAMRHIVLFLFVC